MTSSQKDATAFPLISVVIPCFNQAGFLGEAITSVLAQSCRDFEVIVIDDGSEDSTSEVAQQYSQVRYLKQSNQGLPAARNSGLTASHGRYLIFLDADDRLLPEALTTGLQCLEEHPVAAFVSGGYYRIDESGQIIDKPTPTCINKDHYLALLRGNYVGMHGAVMYRRKFLMECGGFTPSLNNCEDYDLYLRLARTNEVACHVSVVAEYRIHSANKSSDTPRMLAAVLKVLRSQRRYLKEDSRRTQAYEAGLRYWQGYYAGQFVTQLFSGALSGNISIISRGVLSMLRYAPAEFLEAVYQRMVRPILPTSFLRLLARLRGYPYYPPVGRIRFGDLRRLKPISEWFGYDRGLPIDRYYIERFLGAHADDIRGRVLEIGDATYTQRFGEDRVTTCDVFHVEEGPPPATFIGDLTSAEHVPSNAFDCTVITQTLHLIYNVRSALETLYRILKPGGVLLATVPGISQISRDQWGKSWYWSFTTLSMRRLLEEKFPSDSVMVEAQGNVLTATAFLQGIATGELQSEELDYHDDQYELLITVRAVKPLTQEIA